MISVFIVRSTCLVIPKNHSSQQSHQPYPFQVVAADYFEMGTRTHHYLVYVDRYSGWFPLGKSTSAELIRDQWADFAAMGVPEEISCD